MDSVFWVKLKTYAFILPAFAANLQPFMNLLKKICSKKPVVIHGFFYKLIKYNALLPLHRVKPAMYHQLKPLIRHHQDKPVFLR